MTTSEQQRLQLIFKQLPSEQQQTLLAFAEFLQSRVTVVPPTATAPLEPILKPRPADESVIAAIKRLSQSYPMLDKAVLLNKTSLLMSEYMLRGRNKNEVIDELEAVFLRHYEEFIETQEI
jgi:hypothetical protein